MADPALYNQLLTHVLAERPELAQYAEMFQQFTSNDDGSEKIQELEMRLRKLSSFAKRLREDLDDALDHLDNLAKALGACEECWGETTRSKCCHGKGKSGYFQPDRELFDRLILPALREVPWLSVQEK